MQTKERGKPPETDLTWKRFGRENRLVCYGVALLAILGALGLDMLFPPGARPYYFFVGATALAAWYGGWRPGIFSGVFGAAIAAVFVFLPSRLASSGMALAQYGGFLGMLAVVIVSSASLRQKEQELEEMYLHFAGVVQISEDAIITINEQQNITLFNVGAEAIFGYSSSEILGKSINLLLPEPFRKTHSAHLKAFRNSPDVLRPMSDRRTIFGLDKNGREFPAEASISKFEAGGERIMTVRLRDITERLAAEQGLRQLAAIVESSHDAIVGTDLDGIIQSWNLGAEAVYGYTSAEMLGRTADILLTPGFENEIASSLTRARRGEKSSYESVRQRKDGTRIDVALTVSPILDTRGTVVGASSIARDITERRRLEQQLQRSQKMEAVGLLAGGVAHDFNNLLGVILGHASLLQTGGMSREHVSRSGEEIVNAAEKAGALTRQLLAFGRKQITNPKVIDLNEITVGLGKMIPRLLNEDVDVRIIQGEGLRPVTADPSQLEQIVMNMVVNARDAMPNGGKLTIETSNAYFDESAALQHDVTAGEYVLLTVSDTGEGMSDETRAHIFEPFFTTKQMGRGTGLGLSTVYGIVSQNKGHIWVYSELGNGTTFKIYFPATSAPLSVSPQIVQREDDDVSGTETVLLVEDQAPLRELLTYVLRGKGYTVLSADGGEDALRQTSQDHQTVDLLLTDVVMPEMRGDRVASLLAQRYPKMRVIFMSGHTDNALLHNGALPEDLVFLQKPFTPSAMLRLIREVLDESDDDEGQKRTAV